MFAVVQRVRKAFPAFVVVTCFSLLVSKTVSLILLPISKACTERTRTFMLRLNQISSMCVVPY